MVDEGGGEGDAGWGLFPVWGNGDMVLKAINYPASMIYSSYRQEGVREVNSFLSEGGANRFTAHRGDNSDSVSLGDPDVEPATLAASILALVISAQPTEARPLSVSFTVEEPGLARYYAFRSAPGWKETQRGDDSSHTIGLECEFVWDPAANKLAKGSVPLVQLERPGWIILNPEQEKPVGYSERKIAETMQARIRQGLHDGTLSAESNIAKYDLPESGLSRQIGLAGYYEALATGSNGSHIPDKPLDDPFHLENSEFDLYHKRGWVIGMNRVQATAIEVRKRAEETAQKEKDARR